MAGHAGQDNLASGYGELADDFDWRMIEDIVNINIVSAMQLLCLINELKLLIEVYFKIISWEVSVNRGV